MADLILLMILLGVGYIFGQRAEKKHFASLKKRELQFQHLPVSNDRHPMFMQPVQSVHLVMGETVVANDYFKTFSASIKNLFGGRVSSYEALVDRGRREAILRMQAKAKALGADRIVNVRIETTRLAASSSRNQGAPIEVYAYGSAISFAK